MVTHLQVSKRSVHLVNLDPAAENFTYKPTIGEVEITRNEMCAAISPTSDFCFGLVRHSSPNNVGRCHGGDEVWTKWRTDLLHGVRKNSSLNFGLFATAGAKVLISVSFQISDEQFGLV